MKIIVSILAFLNGAYMLLDGIFVIVKGKFIGPDKPGPWANLFYKLNMDVFKLGPLFIIFGLLWLAFLFGMLTNQTWAYLLGIIISALTLWYLPAGTIISILVIIILLTAKKKIGI
jgi:hypothetical protein